MSKVHLTTYFVENPPRTEKSKVDYFDAAIPGFLLEVRKTGRCTYYQRYRDKYGQMKQSRIGPTDSISLDDARELARQIRSQTSMGFDPKAEEERLFTAISFSRIHGTGFLLDFYAIFA